MKNVFLIGNGFDLHHMLPTKYFDFMCVGEYIRTNILRHCSIGDIFSKCSNNPNLERCYNAHQETFDTTPIDFDKLSELANIVYDNIWFDYFSKTLNKDLGWIDFEKEIALVINTLNNIIDDEESNDTSVFVSSADLVARFILFSFSFFVDMPKEDDIDSVVDFQIKKQYLKERIYNTNIYVVDKKKIFEYLYEKLLEFSKALNLYFDCFIESTFESLCNDDHIKTYKINLLEQADITLSFNYTSTVEKLYRTEETYHIHGTVDNNKIVLGINASNNDAVGTNDTALIKFKKYYQREKYETDVAYINWYRETIRDKKKYRVIVIGHSLDETDKDIISTMFLNATEIYITYYDDNCKDDYIANIVKMFGADGWDKFRKDHRMQFIPLSDIEKLSDNLKNDEINWRFSFQ